MSFLVHEKNPINRSIQGISTGSILQKKCPCQKRKPLLEKPFIVGFHVKFRRNHFKKRAESSCPGVHKKPLLTPSHIVLLNSRPFLRSFARFLVTNITKNRWIKPSLYTRSKRHISFSKIIIFRFHSLIFRCVSPNLRWCFNFTLPKKNVGGLKKLWTKKNQSLEFPPTVDGWNPANQLRLILYPIIYSAFSTIPGGFLAGFLNHQQQ